MGSINMASILSKAQKCMGNNDKQQEVKSKVNQAMLGSIKLKTSTGASSHSVEEAAAKFVEVLSSTIQSSGLGSAAIEALSGIGYDTPTDLGNGTYIITVFFEGDLSRPSLQPQKYGRVDDISVLLNNGVDHTMNPVYGEWHDKRIRSKTVIPGVHFAQQAVSDFMANYSTEYNVLSVEPDDVYR